MLLVNCRGTLLNPEEMMAPTIKENSTRSDIAYKLHINHDFVRFIEQFEDDLDIVFYSDYLPLDAVRNILKKAGLTDSNNKVRHTLAFVGQRDVDSRMDKIVANKFASGEKIAIVLDTNKGYNKLCSFLEEHINDIFSQIKLYSVYTRLYTNSGSSFAGLTHNRQKSERESYFFADSVVDISNFIACLLSKPQKAGFFYFNEDAKSSRKRYYLFDYYPIGEGASIEEPFSEEMFKQIKGDSSKSGIPNFFCSTIANLINESDRSIGSCAFVIIPSHTAGAWNSHLANSIKKCLVDKYNLIDSRYAIERISTIPKQSTTNQRDIVTQISSLRFDLKKIGNATSIILLDDITTSGVSVDACRKVIGDSGFKGEIFSFAVGGTQSQIFCISPLKYNIFSTSKPKGDIGYIFDLDGTLLDSSIAKIFRDKGEWENAYSHIPEMRPYHFVIAAIRELISREKDVAVVTSSVSRYCYNVLHYLGIETDSITTVCYHDSNNHKPDAEPYKIAIASMQHDNSTIVSIGDEMIDIKACYNLERETGINTIPILLNLQSNSLSSEEDQNFEAKAYQQFNDEVDFMFSSELFFKDLSKSQMLYQFAAQVDKRYFASKNFQEWLERIGMLKTQNGSRIPTEKGEKCGIRLEKIQTKDGKTIDSVRFSIDAQKKILKILKSDSSGHLLHTKTNE